MNFLKIGQVVGLLLLFAQTSLAQLEIDPSQITIARDQWGMAHIIAKTNPEAAYGLAWANAEDAFDLMQETIIAVKGISGRITGPKGAETDFFVLSIDAKKKAKAHFNELSEDYKKYLGGYCQGINAYAKAFPDKVASKAIFPVKPLDIVMMYTVSSTALSGVPEHVSNIMSGKVSKQKDQPLGSNAYALAPSKTEDGRTYICGNPHFQVDGPFSFYEAHMMTEEGLNTVGVFFHGANTFVIGANPNIAWSHTWNHFDRCDVYQLKMHPKKKLQYEFDGNWKKLQVKIYWLKVKVGKFVIPVPKKFYFSVYGPTYLAPDGQFFSIRAPSMDAFKTGEQLYLMNKATDWKSFREALDMQQLAMFNLVYADKTGNIYYVSNGLMPQRHRGYDWDGTLPGNTSETLWESCYPLDSLPHQFNPDCGYVFNTNNSPFHASCDWNRLQQNSLPSWVDERPGDNNRAIRLKDQLEAQTSFTFEEFKAMKFDEYYSFESPMLKAIEPYLNMDPDRYPELSDVLIQMNHWDGNASPESTTGCLAGLILDYIWDVKKLGDAEFITGLNVSETLYIDGCRYAQKYLMDKFGTIKVPIKDVFKFHKNNQKYSVRGFPDLLSATYFSKLKGEYKVTHGDSYIMFAAYDKQGQAEVRTLSPYATSVGDPAYKSQNELYMNLETKPISFDKATILKEAVKVYSPIAVPR